ncbi:hypothetical protein FJY84_07240 [Candidatus Bathyarchaeota archaeon]|nr:hypothetical protein [Candidatus Bathyarchaeota archaeon]
MTTIAVDDDIKEELLRISSQLQFKLGRRIDFNEVLRFLIQNQVKRPELLDKAIIKDLDSKTFQDELIKERVRDEKKLEGLLRS